MLLGAESLRDLVDFALLVSLPGIFALSWVAGRLLGVRRSWTTTLASGLVGWVTGAGLSLAIANEEATPSAGFTRNVWLFSATFTMSATVWIELLARPGALARAQRGLTSVPRPLRALRRRGRRLQRYAQISRIAVRNGFGPSLGLGSGSGDGDGEGRGRRAPLARRLRLTLEECGGIFVKLGQVLSTRSDLVSPAVADELARLQDNVAPADREAVAALLEEELGGPADEVFAEFDWEPLAAASIGQAHRARAHGGEQVIVKVQRPGIADAVERDLGVLDQLAHVVEARTSWGADYGVVDLADEFADRLREEVDFRIEARNASEIGANLADDAGVRVPSVHHDITTARVMVQEWLDGTSVRDRDRLDELGVDRRALAESLLRCMLHQMLVDGRFHADPHPGNVMVLADGRIALIDFGASSRLDALQQGALRELMLGVARADPEQLRLAVLQMATFRRPVDDDELERALARFVTRHLAPGTPPSAAMFNDLLQLFFAFGINVAPELSTFFRALVILEGTLTTLCPGFATIEAAERIVGEMVQEAVTPASLEELARDELLRVAPLLRRLPRHAERVATALERGNLRLRVSRYSDPEDVRVLTRLVNRVVLAFLGGVVGVIGVLLIGTGGGPAFTGETSLYEFFGYFALFCGTILVMRVLVAVFHEGQN